MFLTSLDQASFEPLEKEGAHKVKVKYLIDKPHGASRFFLRYYLVEPGGHTPLDKHAYEHEVYVLDGNGLLVEEKDGLRKTVSIKPGDSILVGSDELHQFLNVGDSPLVFLCVKGAPELYDKSDMGKAARLGSH